MRERERINWSGRPKSESERQQEKHVFLIAKFKPAPQRFDPLEDIERLQLFVVHTYRWYIEQLFERKTMIEPKDQTIKRDMDKVKKLHSRSSTWLLVILRLQAFFIIFILPI